MAIGHPTAFWLQASWCTSVQLSLGSWGAPGYSEQMVTFSRQKSTWKQGFWCVARLRRPCKERGTEAGILTALYLPGSFYFFGLWGHVPHFTYSVFYFLGNNIWHTWLWPQMVNEGTHGYIKLPALNWRGIVFAPRPNLRSFTDIIWNGGVFDQSLFGGDRNL